MRWCSELVLAGIFAMLTVVSALWPTWIEMVFKGSPDAGGGEDEWWLAVVFGVLAVITVLVGRRELVAARRVAHEGIDDL